jgi:poly(A) polymerase
MRDIWAMQPRFERRVGKAPYKLLEHLRFRAGYDFLLLRCASGEIDAEIGEWWTAFYEGDEPRAKTDFLGQPAIGRRQAAQVAPRKRGPRRGGRNAAAAVAAKAAPNAEPAHDGGGDSRPHRS